MGMDPLHVVFWDQKKAANRVFRITQRVERTPGTFGAIFIAEEMSGHGWRVLKDLEGSTVDVVLGILQNDVGLI